MACPYWNLTIPHCTPVSHPLKIHKGIRTGRIVEISAYFPAGCDGLVGVQVYHREHILAPTDKGEWIIGDNKTWQWKLDWLIYGSGNYIGLHGYNIDDSHDHTVEVAISLLPRWSRQ